MKRFIHAALEKWKISPSRRPLIIRGARQVGKTWSVMEFGTSAFERVHLFDFEKTRTLHRIFEGDLEPRQILFELEAHCGAPIVPGKNLVFFDEIQACPRAVTALRYFYEMMPDLHVIAAGSLLEIALSSISFPVGRVEFLWMHPMTFAEFLEATGHEILLRALPSLDVIQPLPDSIHLRLLEKLRLYFSIGGMPEAVRAYSESGSLAETEKIHALLTRAYIEDFPKYSGRMSPEIIQHVYENLPMRIGRQVKYAPLYPEKRVEQIKRSLQILEQSLIVHKVRSTSAKGSPLGAETSEKTFKYVFLDIGLLRHMAGVPAARILQEQELVATFHGAMAEQFFGQELLAANGSENGNLYYWSRNKPNSCAEVDYLLHHENRIVPVEVKSGAAGRLKSLHLFLQEHPQSPYGMVFNSGNIKQFEKERLKFFPLYTRLN